MFADFTITPYTSVGPVRLGMSRADLHAALGTPSQSRKSRFNQNILDYWNGEGLSITSTGEQGHVIEVGFGSEQANAEVAGVKLFARRGADVFRDLCLLDGAAKQDVGIAVLFKLGVSLSGFEVHDQDERAVTVFAKEVWSVDDPDLKPVFLD